MGTLTGFRETVLGDVNHENANPEGIVRVSLEKEKILADTDHYCPAVDRYFTHSNGRFGHRSVHLHPVLT